LHRLEDRPLATESVPVVFEGEGRDTDDEQTAANAETSGEQTAQNDKEDALDIKDTRANIEEHLRIGAL